MKYIVSMSKTAHVKYIVRTVHIEVYKLLLN